MAQPLAAEHHLAVLQPHNNAMLGVGASWIAVELPCCVAYASVAQFHALLTVV